MNLIVLAAVDPALPKVLLLAVIIIGLGSLLRYLHQPYVIAYILAGVLLGEHGFGLITDEETIRRTGDLGLMLLLFFIGMEVSLDGLIKNWKLATLGTGLQILGAVLMVWIIGSFYDWPLNRIVILGFVISLSSSAVVIKLLQDNDESQSEIGQNVISILLMQDILIVPMLIATNYLGGTTPSTTEIILQLIGGLLIVATMIWIIRKKEIRLPFADRFEEDHELQVFLAIIVCFGLAWITALFGLSAALGAFVAGIIVSAARSTTWFHDSLHSFRVIFVALFFVSVGMLIDIHFIIEHWAIIGLLILVVYLSNHFVNAAVLHYFGSSWRKSLYGGALLAQIGELSFVLIATGYSAGIISEYAYQLTIVIISLTLLLSPFWIATTKRLVGE